jgi:hypothetical protein
MPGDEAVPGLQRGRTEDGDRLMAGKAQEDRLREVAKAAMKAGRNVDDAVLSVRQEPGRHRAEQKK